MQRNANAAVAETPSPRKPGECVVERWLDFLGHRWNALIVWHLGNGPKRNGALMELLPGVTPKVLSERLEGLCRAGLVERVAEATFPRSVSYRLTTSGRELITILDQIDIWAHRQSPPPVHGAS